VILDIVISLVVSIACIWAAFFVVLAITKPRTGTLTEAARIVPDTVRLIHRLARDRSLHRGIRVRLWLLLAYLVCPIDLVPDFIPVIGYADDVIIISLVLRSVVKRAGVAPVRDYWPGSPEGLEALSRLCRLPDLSTRTE
jgi:uncharacterized membrane protein YkvA (DUF1232 family)